MTPHLEWLRLDLEVYIDPAAPIEPISGELATSERPADIIELHALHTLQLNGRPSSLSKNWTVPSLKSLSICGARGASSSISEFSAAARHIKMLNCSSKTLSALRQPLSDLYPDLEELSVRLRRGTRWTNALNGHPSLRRVDVKTFEANYDRDNHELPLLETFLQILANPHAFPALATIRFHKPNRALLQDLREMAWWKKWGAVMSSLGIQMIDFEGRGFEPE